MIRCLLLACLAVGAFSKDEMVRLMKIPEFGFHAKVEATNMLVRETIYVDEYFAKYEDMGHLNILKRGNRMGIYYYNKTQQLLFVEGKECTVSSYKKTPDVLYEFYGWKLKDYKLFGPSALFFLVDGREQDLKISEDVIRGIKCISLTLDIKSLEENVTITYYVDEPKWKNPFSDYKGYIPVRTEVKGIIMFNNKPVHIDQILDYAYFDPVPRMQDYEPPYGIGCIGKKDDDDLDFSKPTFKNSFSFSEEYYDLKTATNAESTICSTKVWYDFTRKLVRYDSHCGGFVSTLEDYDTGVAYRIVERKDCGIAAIDNSYFETYREGSIVGELKTPNELFGFNKYAYYLGQTTTRGILCDVYEESGKNVILGVKRYHKIIATFFFTAMDVEVSVEGEMKDRVLVRLLIKGYKQSNDTEPELNEEINLFRFTNGFTKDFARTFDLESCFPEPSQKSYFTLFFKENPEAIQLAQKNNILFESLLEEYILMVTQVSLSRLSYFKVDYLDTGIIATGILLERPPYIAGFNSKIEGVPLPTEKEKWIIEKKIPLENCAKMCTQYVEPCLFFHFCGGDCYLSTMTLDDDWGPNRANYKEGDCQFYKRNVLNSTTRDSELNDALASLKDNYKRIKISIKEENKDEFDVFIPAAVDVGSDPYEKEGEEDMYTVAFTDFGFDPAVENVLDVGEVATERECYHYCRDIDSMSCSSFAYCKKTKSCRLTSVIAQKDDATGDILDQEFGCRVYTRAFLNQFTEYKGMVTILAGKKSVASKSSEQCAHICKNEESFTCRGFEYCSNAKSCVLHETHYMDLNSSHVTSSAECSHFALNFTFDYGLMGKLMITNKDGRTFDGVSIEDCARKCSEEFASECNTFNYCPPSQEESSEVQTCSLSSHQLTDNDTETSDTSICFLYSKRYGNKGWIKPLPDKKPDKKPVTKIEEDGYSGGTFAGILVGMIVLGLAVGVGVFVGYSRYKARKAGEDMSVKFVNSP